MTSVQRIADEILIVDSGSTDRTKEIALEHGAVFYSEPWKGYGLQRNSAIEKCQGPWILTLDADEEISEALAERILKIKETETSIRIFSISFISYCFGKAIRHGGWSNFHRIRLFQKGSGQFNANVVHEEFITDQKINILSEPIYHHTNLTVADYLRKMNRYTTEGALEYDRKQKKAGIIAMLIHPIYKFFHAYVFRLGFLDGVEGFLLASTSAMATMIKYYKLREIGRNRIDLEKKVSTTKYFKKE